MRRSVTSVGLRFTLALTAAVCILCLLALPDRRLRSEGPRYDLMRSFQRMVGGMGMGAAVVPAWNVLHYDPRLQPVDDSSLWPIAGGYPYSPSAASSAVTFTEIPREDLVITKVEP